MFRKPVNANQLKASLIKETGCRYDLIFDKYFLLKIVIISDNAAETVLRKTRWNLTSITAIIIFNLHIFFAV